MKQNLSVQRAFQIQTTCNLDLETLKKNGASHSLQLLKFQGGASDDGSKELRRVPGVPPEGVRLVVAALGTRFPTVDADSAQHILLACGREKRGPYRGLAPLCNSSRVLTQAAGVNRLWSRFRWSRLAAPRPCLPTIAGLHGGSWCLFPHSCHPELG